MISLAHLRDTIQQQISSPSIYLLHLRSRANIQYLQQSKQQSTNHNPTSKGTRLAVSQKLLNQNTEIKGKEMFFFQTLAPKQDTQVVYCTHSIKLKSSLPYKQSVLQKDPSVKSLEHTLSTTLNHFSLGRWARGSGTVRFNYVFKNKTIEREGCVKYFWYIY